MGYLSTEHRDFAAGREVGCIGRRLLLFKLCQALEELAMNGSSKGLPVGIPFVATIACAYLGDNAQQGGRLKANTTVPSLSRGQRHEGGTLGTLLAFGHLGKLATIS